jgi:hypothetical protein
MPNPRHEGSHTPTPVTSAHAAITVAKHKAIAARQMVAAALSGAPQQSYFKKIPCFEPGNKGCRAR